MSENLPGIAPVPVSRWFAEHVAGAVLPLTFAQIAGGKSNLTYRVDDAAGHHYVLRRPPLGHVLESAHDMGREHTIISAVGKTAVPVAPALGYCVDTAVNGAPFYVMGFVEGLVLDSPETGLQLAPAVRGAAARSLIDVLAALHRVVPDEIGLGELGRKEGYVDRQLKRWTRQWHASKTRELPTIERVQQLLEQKKPPQLYTGIVHGDYRLGNCIVDPATGAIRAVLDWELCTLGDQLADIGYVLMYWSDPGDISFVGQDPSGTEGFPGKAELKAMYGAATGRDVSAVPYYESFACWRLACIAEGVLARYNAGVMGDSTGFDMAASQLRVERLADRALEIIEAL